MSWKVGVLMVACALGTMAYGGEGKPTTGAYPVGAWYWLNAVPPEAWDKDLALMKASGFDYVVGCFGYDATAWIKRPADTRRFLQAAREAGLNVYLSIWNPSGSDIRIRSRSSPVRPSCSIRE